MCINLQALRFDLRLTMKHHKGFIFWCRPYDSLKHWNGNIERKCHFHEIKFI